MYALTLTAGERKALDWIGNRYAHGDDLYRLLWGKCKATPDDADWDDSRPITFAVPEHVAWQIRDMGEDCDYCWDCFADPLCDKLNTFCGEIV